MALVTGWWKLDRLWAHWRAHSESKKYAQVDAFQLFVKLRRTPQTEPIVHELSRIPRAGDGTSLNTSALVGSDAPALARSNERHAAFRCTPQRQSCTRFRHRVPAIGDLNYFGPLKNSAGPTAEMFAGSSLASKRVHRMHVRGATCRYPAGAQRHDQQQTCRGRQRDQIR